MASYVVDGFSGAETSTDGTVITTAIVTSGSTFALTPSISLSVTPLTEWFVNTVELGPLNNAVAVVSGAPLTDAGGTRSWRHNLLAQEFIFVTFNPIPSTTSWSMGFLFKTDLNGTNPGNLQDFAQIDTLNVGNSATWQVIDGNPLKGQFESSSILGTKHIPTSGGVTIQSNHVYWITIKLDVVAGMIYGACYDPSNWSLIFQGSQVISTNDQQIGRFRLGGANHGNLVNFNGWYDCLMYDATHGQFPLGLGIGSDDANRTRSGLIRSAYLSDNPNIGGQF